MLVDRSWLDSGSFCRLPHDLSFVALSLHFDSPAARPAEGPAINPQMKKSTGSFFFSFLSLLFSFYRAGFLSSFPPFPLSRRDLFALQSGQNKICFAAFNRERSI
jgi:hypothetical protein